MYSSTTRLTIVATYRGCIVEFGDSGYRKRLFNIRY